MLLAGKKGLVLNVTNEYSIGWAIAKALADHGAHVGVGAQNEKMQQRVQKLIGDDDRFSQFIIDFADDAQLDQLAVDVKERMGKIDFLVHSAAFANKEDLQGRFIDSSRDGFSLAADISAFSLVRLCRVLEDVINDDGSVMCLSYLGSVRACLNYNIMGVAKAALESCVRYLAVDLGPRGIRVNTLSPGPINTISARGVKGLLDMIEHVNMRSPLKREYGQEEVAGSAVYLASDLSRGVTGQVIYIDNGYNIVGM